MTDKLRTAAQRALDWLELTWICELSGDCVYPTQIASDLRSALAEDAMQRLTDVQQEIEQGPVVVIKRNESGQIVMQTPDGNPFDMSKYIGSKFYTAPQQREWQGLTKEEIEGELDKEFKQWWSRHFSVCKAIERKLKEKNT